MINVLIQLFIFKKMWVRAKFMIIQRLFERSFSYKFILIFGPILFTLSFSVYTKPCFMVKRQEYVQPTKIQILTYYSNHVWDQILGSSTYPSYLWFSKEHTLHLHLGTNHWSMNNLNIPVWLFFNDHTSSCIHEIYRMGDERIFKRPWIF